MFDIFGQIQSLIKATNVQIDNNIFRFHYRLTVLLLVTSSLIVGSRKYFGDPIDCTATDKKIERIVDNFCWFNSYIIVPRDPDGVYTGVYHPYRPVVSSATLEDLSKPNSIYKPYFLHAYQWIEFILFLQAVLFFLPRYLWRYCWEQGRVKALSEGFGLISLKKDDDDQQKYVDVARYLRRNKYNHIEYACKYVICEVLNFVNVLTQYCLLRSTMGIEWNVLLNDFFTSSSNVNTESPLNRVFPNLARCEVLMATGASHVATPELCVLPGNVFTTKIYIFLWFYMAGLAIITGISLIFRCATIASPTFRLFLMKRSGIAITKNYSRVIWRLGYGEWFLLSLVGKNMDAFSFKNLLQVYSDNGIESRPSFSTIGMDKINNADPVTKNNINKEVSDG